MGGDDNSECSGLNLDQCSSIATCAICNCNGVRECKYSDYNHYSSCTTQGCEWSSGLADDPGQDEPPIDDNFGMDDPYMNVDDPYTINQCASLDVATCSLTENCAICDCQGS